MVVSVTEHTVTTRRHTTFYLSAGPRGGTPIIFLHGWPELSLSWRHQLPVFGALGFHAVAPDMRGHGRSSLYATHEAYAQHEAVADMIELIDSLGAERAIWVGHDWGAPTVWNIASHHPERCLAAAGLCVPYATLERGLEALLPLVNRDIYPEREYPCANWEYMKFYEENFAAACEAMEANVENTFKSLFRSGSPENVGKPSRLSHVRKDKGWFGGQGIAPDVPRDEAVLSDSELCAYVSAYKRTGFFGTDSYYMNHRVNAEYAQGARDDGIINLPVLFLEAALDTTCDCVNSRLTEPMRALCRDLTVRRVASGHWMAQERPVEVNAHLAQWLARSVSQAWRD